MVQGKDPNEGYQTEQVEEEEIPMPTYENLQTIIEELTAMNDLPRKRKLSSIIVSENVRPSLNWRN